MHTAAPSHQKHTHTHTHWVKQQVLPLEWGVISYAFTLYLHRSAQAPSVCLCTQPSLSFICVCVCVCLLVRAHVSARMIERKSERSVRQLYLHLYEQIPVGRATEEHTSCLTYIPYQAVFVCTVPWHTHADRHVDEAFALFVGPGQLQGYLHRPWLTYRPPMCKSMLFVFSNFVFYTSKTNSKSSCSAPSSLDLDFGVFPLSKWGDNVESDVA